MCSRRTAVPRRNESHKLLAAAGVVLLMSSGQLLLHVGVSVPHKRFVLRRLTELGICPRCGYDVRATPQRCPECGTLVGTE